MSIPWWKSAVFYQIYPRSFADSNGDGIGDLDGITAHLDYLGGAPNSLGVGAIWLNPINPSPLADWGYDVSDYCGVHPDFGGLAAFDRLVAKAHRRQIRVIVDLVPNHTSEQHPWFVASRSSRSNPKRDWYIWAPGPPDRPPNNWQSLFGGPAWKYDAPTGEWYLHMFLEQQPDLNFRNPAVVAAMHDVIRFWLDRGADGFRIDVISQLIKDARLRDNPLRADADPHIPLAARGTQIPVYSTDQPEVHELIRGFRRVLDGYPGDRMMVGETWPREANGLADYLRADELQLGFNFRFLFCPYDANKFRAAIEDTERTFGAGAWPTWTLSNHDFPRHVTRYSRHGGDGEARARVAVMMLMTLRGTPFIYYGEELAMPNVESAAERKRDPVGRDGCRSPMQWSDAPNGGFANAGVTPWLPCGDFTSVNAARQAGDPRSMLSLYRRLIKMRAAMPVLVEGGYRGFDGAPEDCLVYFREIAGSRAMVALNFTTEPREIKPVEGKLVMSTNADRIDEPIHGTLRLAPNEGALLAL
ncbi:MAG TPA: alpha-amylase family glycosyl hydrolase [Candidatus Binataceae bacterium]